MATPYFQVRYDSVPSTQDVARERFVDLPLLVIAAHQTKGRGRSGSQWQSADRSLAASLIFNHSSGDRRPFSLMAGVAAVRATEGTTLKWPNDVLDELHGKVGGILVERDDTRTVVGLGLNLWWSQPPPGTGALFPTNPGPESHVEIGAVWGAELMDLVAHSGWPISEYEEHCATLGREIEWEPGGQGRAVGIARDGALLVRRGSEEERLVSGAVRHVRSVEDGTSTRQK